MPKIVAQNFIIPFGRVMMDVDERMRPIAICDTEVDTTNIQYATLNNTILIVRIFKGETVKAFWYELEGGQFLKIDYLFQHGGHFRPWKDRNRRRGVHDARSGARQHHSTGKVRGKRPREPASKAKPTKFSKAENLEGLQQSSDPPEKVSNHIGDSNEYKRLSMRWIVFSNPGVLLLCIFAERPW